MHRYNVAEMIKKNFTVEGKAIFFSSGPLSPPPPSSIYDPHMHPPPFLLCFCFSPLLFLALSHSFSHMIASARKKAGGRGKRKDYRVNITLRVLWGRRKVYLLCTRISYTQGLHTHSAHAHALAGEGRRHQVCLLLLWILVSASFLLQ